MRIRVQIRCEYAAWKQFQQIDPEDSLFAQIMDGLQEQLSKVNRSGAYWPYPASWLGQESWFDNIM